MRWTLEQLLDFALFYARDGDAEARRVLYEQAAEQASVGGGYGASQLIELDGIAGFLFFANRFGEAMQSDAKLWDDDYLLRLLSDTGAQADDATLRAAAQPKYPFVATYLDHVADTQAQREQGRKRPSLLENHTRNFGNLSRLISDLRLVCYGAGARRHRRTIYYRLHATYCSRPTTKRLEIYLSIFAERAFPLGFEPLLPLVWSEHERVACRGLQAIGQFQHPAVRELGFTLFEKQHHVADALDLFVQNFQAGTSAIWLRC